MESQTEKKESTIVCSNCKTVNSAGSYTCSKCGVIIGKKKEYRNQSNVPIIVIISLILLVAGMAMLFSPSTSPIQGMGFIMASVTFALYAILLKIKPDWKE